MDKVARIFRTSEQADQADKDFYRALTPNERVNMALEIIWKPYGDSPPRLERVLRKVRRKDLIDVAYVDGLEN